MDKEALLEEAKRRYPIGSSYKSAETSKRVYTVVEQNFTAISDKVIWAEDSKGCLFYKGDWAEIINKEPEYVECIKSSNLFTCGKIYNWPFPIDDNGLKRDTIFNLYPGWVSEFKPSTKEAYDAQEKEKCIAINGESWEPTEEICKNCANIYYNGSVNTGPHNLCEGRHCEDMKEEEWKPKVGDKVMFKPGLTDSQFNPKIPHTVDKVDGHFIYELSGEFCCLSFNRFQPYYKGAKLTYDKNIIPGQFYTPPPDTQRAIYSEPTKLQAFIPKEQKEIKSFQAITLKTIQKLTVKI